jgi:hypothetical protein
MKFIILLIALMPIMAQCEQLEWEDCGSKSIKLNKFDIQPNPLENPSDATLSLNVKLNRNVQGILRGEIDIVRLVGGIKLPVKCYIADGVSVGSCKYADVCKFIKDVAPSAFNKDQCPPDLAKYGIDCECPFRITSSELVLDKTAIKIPGF